jgi:hypothetical protein
MIVKFNELIHNRPGQMPAAEGADHLPMCFVHAGSVSGTIPFPAPGYRGGRCGSRLVASNSSESFVHSSGQFHPTVQAHGRLQSVAHRPSAAWAMHPADDSREERWRDRGGSRGTGFARSAADEDAELLNKLSGA